MKRWAGKFLTVLVWVGVLGVCFGEEAGPSAEQLLARYIAARDKVCSFALKYEEVSQVEKRLGFKNEGLERHRSGHIGEVRTDGERYFSLSKFWADDMPGRPQSKSEAQKDEGYTSLLWKNGILYNYMRSYGGPEKDILFIAPRGATEENNGKSMIRSMGGRSLAGVFDAFDSDKLHVKYIDEELSSADKLWLQGDVEEVGGCACYVLCGQTQESSYKVWIDPEHGYNIARAKVLRKREPRQMGSPRPYETKLSLSLDDVRFESINGTWIPMEADYEYLVEWPGGDFLKEQRHIKRMEFLLNPDHVALESFGTDHIRNGTPTQIVGVRGVVYTWRDGKVVDGEGKEVDIKGKVKREK